MQAFERLVARRALALPAALLIAAPALADITVGPSGSGAQYDQIADAITAAPAGETLRVAPGTYQPFVLDKPLTILGAGSDVVVIDIAQGSNEGAVDVVGIPAGQRATISGLAITDQAASRDGRIEITDCAGRVHLLDVVSEAVYGVTSYSDEATLRVSNSSAVVCEHCVFVGLRSHWPQEWMQGSPGVHALQSRVWLNDCVLVGGRGNDGHGGAGLLAQNGSFVHATRTMIEGGDGGAHFGFEWWDIYGYSGEEAVTVDASTVVLAGGDGNMVRGGAGHPVDGINWSGGGAAVLLIGGSVLRTAPDTALENGVNGDGSITTAPAVHNPPLGGSSEIAETSRRSILGTADPVVAPGGNVVVNAAGEPGAQHMVFASPFAIAPLEVPGLGQHVHLEGALAIPITVLTLDGTGTGGFAVTLPNLTGLTGLEFVMQSIDLDLSALRLSNPALVLVGQ